MGTVKTGRTNRLYYALIIGNRRAKDRDLEKQNPEYSPPQILQEPLPVTEQNGRIVKPESQFKAAGATKEDYLTHSE
ncbi:MAG: hypothetical protein KAV00_03355 [Phycisphaerae bacterium]|nr:hypothetical protein [Phycisphaerae bacterium]